MPMSCINEYFQRCKARHVLTLRLGNYIALSKGVLKRQRGWFAATLEQ